MSVLTPLLAALQDCIRARAILRLEILALGISFRSLNDRTGVAFG
jgi:hypothetical protein